ncbi:MAG: transcription repressor NadR [Lachnospiraceae bacterium]|nr:transcription repressor NadR [Lachnospiraceae bacterium]
MDGDRRRDEIIRILEENSQEGHPVAGTELAGRLNVSRQVIVQDIALLRAVNKNILSTNKGYLLFQEGQGRKAFKRAFKVKHSCEQMKDELYAIVDCGGRLLDVVVEHPIYGQIMVDLIIRSRQDADNFVKQVEEYGTKPLNELTYGIHYHTVEADSAEILDMIEKALLEKNFLLSQI